MDKNKLQASLLLILLAFIWGSSFILIKKGLTAFTPGQVGSLRITITGLAFLPYVLLNTKRLKLEKFWFIIAFAVLEIGIPPYLYSIAQTHVDSGTAGILNSLVPLFTLLTGIMFFGLTFNVAKLGGVLLGLLGAVLLVFTRTGLDGSGFQLDFTNAFGLLIVLATLMYGLGTNILKKFLSDVSGMVTVAFSFVILSIPAGAYLVTTDVFSIDYAVPKNLYALLALITLALMGSGLAMYLFTIVTKKTSALFASFVTYLIPFVALVWGFLDGEPLNVMQFVCLLFILGGIYIANKGRLKKNKASSKQVLEQ